MEQTYFRKGFGLKKELRPLIDSDYQSALVERIRSRGYTDQFGDITVHLAKEFGFCYGVDRAIDYAYETVHQFPERQIHLLGELIHNPHVNKRMTDMGIAFLYPDSDGSFDFSHLTPEDVVILPAFGLTLQDFENLKKIGCILVDTTCGSVLVVWKRVEKYAKDGFTAVIHGKYTHEESRATASQVEKHEGGKYIIVRDMDEGGLLFDYIAKRPGHLSREAFIEHFASKASEGFDPDTDLEYIGVANQTTMLAKESLAIGWKVHEAFVERFGEEHASTHFRSFGTICSATQERQDAVADMMEDSPDVMLVIGGYNSSNTNHLAHLCRQHTATFHVEDAACINIDTGSVLHKPELDPATPEVEDYDWLPEGPFSLGITAGASTPNNKIGEALIRILQVRGIDIDLRMPEAVG
ncbi:MAG: 4-hydroxy-3-methylbut-2-enyl diphosphate reductase [Euryarchaeota archaeon]|nr:4-hydroxy-3-methylbut-2-enyl diphosphate reductase [Euryarchaeota archaeon]